MTAGRCPSKAEIVRYLEGEGPRNGSSRELLDHVASCPDCRVVFEAALEIGSKAGSVLRDLEALDLANPGTTRRVRAQARREIRLLRAKKRRAWLGRRRWLAIPATGAALALAALFLVPGGHRAQTSGRERGPAASEIGLVQPRGTVSARELDFRWTHESGARSCRLEIFDQALGAVYESGPVAQDHFALPAGVRGALDRGAVYFWKVVLMLNDGRTIESEFAAFVLQK